MQCRPDDDFDAGRGRGDRRLQEGRPARQEHVRPRAVVVDVRPELEHSEAFIREKFARKPDIAEANVLALKAGWNYGETTEAFATTYEVSPAKLKSGEYRQISGNTALPTASSPPAGCPVSRWCSAATRSRRPRHPARAVQAQELQRRHLPGRGRDRRHRRGTGCVLRWRAGRHQHRARPVAEGRGARPGRDDRVAAAGHRRAARRSLDRAADQDRAGRPDAGAVRPQRRIAGRGARAAVAVGLLRDRVEAVRIAAPTTPR